MSYPTETMSNIRLHGMVNAELIRRGKDPIVKVSVDHPNIVRAWRTDGKILHEFTVGYIEYVPGLGEVFNFEME
jgi:hypothetical protein